MATSEVIQEAEWEGGSGKFSSLRMQDTKKGPREKAGLVPGSGAWPPGCGRGGGRSL